jgi:hypothetical protein
LLRGRTTSKVTSGSGSREEASGDAGLCHSFVENVAAHLVKKEKSGHGWGHFTVGLLWKAAPSFFGVALEIRRWRAPPALSSRLLGF